MIFLATSESFLTENSVLATVEATPPLRLLNRLTGELHFLVHRFAFVDDFLLDFEGRERGSFKVEVQHR